MRTLRHARNLWIPLLTTAALASVGAAAAQVRYSVTDLGSEGNDDLGCAMSLNNQGWTEIMAGVLAPVQVDYLFGQILSGRAVIDVDGFKTDLGTLGGPNSWMMWGEINDSGQTVGDSETAAPDPNGEDICGFGTHLTCRPFVWQPSNISARPVTGQMSALPTLGGNNGQASAINNRGQIVGFAENGTVDSTCPAGTANDMVDLPVLWEHGSAQALPTVDNNPDGVAYWINDEGEAVGYSGNCTTTLHAVSWKHGTPTVLSDLGNGGAAYSVSNQGDIAGAVGSADGTTQTGAIWQDGKLTSFKLLPGDFGGIGTGINNKDQVVGSNYDSNFMWAHGFIWQGGVVTDLNKLFPASSNLYVTMANKINDRGQISGMAIVMSGPDEGSIHAFLATPIANGTGESVADVAPTRPKSNSQANPALWMGPQ